MDKPFPFQLQHSFFTRFSINSNEKFVQGDGTPVNIDQSTTINVALPDNDPKLIVAILTLKIDASDKTDVPYSIDLEAHALLRIITDEDRANLTGGAIQVGHNILYGAVREAILYVTGRHVWGPFGLGISQLQIKSKDTAEAAVGK